MHIVMFSINPLSPTQIMGGAPKHLQQIAMHLGRKGHDVTVLCTKSYQGTDAFYWHPRVQVRPILGFKQPFPQPYAVPAYELGNIINTVATFLKQADRFYMHDGEFLFPYVHRDIPTVVSLRDNLYPETILGGYLFAAHRLILISEYSRQYYRSTVGRFFPEFDQRTQVIYNGIDWKKFSRVPTGGIRKFLGLEGVSGSIVLHPHRPESSKGLTQTIEVADLLVHEYGFKDLLVLAPKWHEMQSNSDLQAYYELVDAEVRDRKLEDHFLLHNWIPQDLMPQYYSLGSVTLSLGSFPESFGNAVYESLGCGTLVAAARVSTHRELVPDALLEKVDYGDIAGAAELAARIISARQRTSAELLDYLHQRYSLETQMDAYEAAILDAKVAEPMAFRAEEGEDRQRYKLAHWCYISEQWGIYHDFRADYLTEASIIQLIKAHPSGFTLKDANRHHVSRKWVKRLYHEGYLVPVQ